MNKSFTFMLIAVFFLTAPAYADARDKDKTREKNALESILELPFAATEKVVNVFFDTETLVITPTRTAEKASTVEAPTSVFNEASLQKRGIYFVKDALRKDYGIDVAQSGSSGGPASIFIRGANSGQTRVMIDGVHVFDPMSTNGAFDFAHLTTDNVQQIEVVKGPQSSLYGSDAIGGVVNIITKKGAGTPKINAFAEGGSFGTDREGFDLNGQSGDFHFALAGSHYFTDGVSSAASRLGNPEKDGYGSETFATRLDYNFSDVLDIAYIGRYNYAKYDYDDGGGANQDDVNRTGWSNQYLTSFIINHRIFENLDQKIQLSETANHRRDFDDPDPAHPDDYLRDWYYGDTTQADWTLTYRAWERNTFLAGVEYLREKGASYSHGVYGPGAFDNYESIFPKRYARTTGYFGEYRFNWNDRFSTTAAYRLEDHSTFNTHSTYRFDALYQIDKINTKLKTSYGTGFKAPTLYELYAPAIPFEFDGGNTNLRPETSTTYEFGIEQPFGGRFDAGVNYFNTEFKDLIDAVFNPATFITSQYENINRAHSHGYEFDLKYRITQALTLIGNYTLLTTEDEDTRKELLRRAKNKINVDLNYAPSPKWNVNFDLSYVGRREDSGDLLLKPYVKADLTASYDLNDHWTAYVRIENLFNERYEEVKGFGTPGFGVFGGARTRF